MIAECVGGQGLAAMCQLLAQDFSGSAGEASCNQRCSRRLGCGMLHCTAGRSHEAACRAICWAATPGTSTPPASQLLVLPTMPCP